ncbi:mechanosensitive ion channel family protein [Microvirga puerhi]|uniref:Mechanosensitive ion channel family protein n=1 Tax=Microvirga puerhi TaxID=2876078 RepID=A0ABS7VTV9_9HYPH|nr:mechanosensitive ion channel family protein [Microvirga puerhi]MBZ6078535.1 mechanosensitive ion channel family protein [Microvirga puerhi]
MGADRLLKSILLALMSLMLNWSVSQAATASAPASEPPPAQVQQLLQLLQDPAVRTWIDKQQSARTQLQPDEAASPPASEMMTERIAGLREHLVALAQAAPRLPEELRQGLARLIAELQGRSLYEILVLIAAFLILGAGIEWLFEKVTAGFRERFLALPRNTPTERLRAVALRLAFSLSEVTIFALGSIGAFLAFDWPPILKEVVIACLIAGVALRLALVGGQFLLAPHSESATEVAHFRLVPTTDEAAVFWYRRLALFVGWFAIGWATIDVLRALDVSQASRALVAYGLGLGLLMIAINVVWTHPHSSAATIPPEQSNRHISKSVVASLLSVCFVLLWGLWVAGLMRLFWLGVVAILLPLTIRITERASQHIFRTGNEVPPSNEPKNLMAVYLDRGLRALLITGAALFLAHVWQIDLVAMTNQDTLLNRLLRGLLSSVVILLVADLIWQVTKTFIDRRLAQISAIASPGSEEALRQARLRTLLPIFRSIILVVLVVVAALMALAALGVEIGPLIAGAGIVGVAVGFGSQTLVRDVISGVFYLLDDAFRVGEYIQSGNYKGTVESLGFRSVKLRHHRGPIYTVPYGQLGAVENMSRDWVIDKMAINVTYDTDLAKAKQVIKKIGRELAEDPEFSPYILEPLKMQGVEQFGDFAIQIRLKMMTRPGQQFAIRRRANMLIKKAFDDNGIRFAFPTVQVAGREDEVPAAAQEGLKLLKQAPE